MIFAKSKLPMIFQVESAECGLACLAMVAGYHGNNIKLSVLRSRFTTSLVGVSLRNILAIAAQMGFSYSAKKCEIEDVPTLKCPAILHWNLQHFVVLRKATRDNFIVHDPSRGVRKISRREMSDHFSGIAIELLPSNMFRVDQGVKRMALRDLIRSTKIVRPWIVQVIQLSIILEFFVLLQPFLMRSVVDVGFGNKDPKFVYSVIVILAFAVVIQGCTALLRDYVGLRAGTIVNLDIMKNVFERAIRMPIMFFEKRAIGHLVERYRVTDDIERFLISTLPLALIDGIVTSLTLCIIMWFSPLLGIFAFTAPILYFLIRGACFDTARSRERDLLWSKGEENGHLIETLTAISTIKNNALEDARFATWLSRYHQLIRGQMRFGAIEVLQRSGKTVTTGLHFAVFLLIAYESIVLGKITLGTLFAVLFYNNHFVQRSTLLVEKYFEYRLLELRIERLEDIMHAEPALPGQQNSVETAQVEQEGRSGNNGSSHPTDITLQGGICVRNLSYSYGLLEGDVFSGISFDISPGECVAIAGQNGTGKTTLFKLILGLYSPKAGNVMFDDREPKAEDWNCVRSQIGFVAQDDRLLTGTITENIALFAQDISLDRVADCAEIAGIRDFIESMPLGYHTRVGDIASPFSQGQLQKILLARALYKNPKILMLDEGTANIDSDGEQSILDNLLRLPMTKLMISHRESAIMRATRVLQLQDGRIVQTTDLAGSLS